MDIMRKSTFAIVIAGTAATAVLSVASVAELMRYSPYEDPGALTAGLWLGGSALVLAGLLLAWLGLSAGIRAARSYLRWQRSLTPGARIAVSMGEIMAMGSAHEAWSHHNRRVSQELTSSVMGEDRSREDPWT